VRHTAVCVQQDVTIHWLAAQLATCALLANSAQRAIAQQRSARSVRLGGTIEKLPASLRMIASHAQRVPICQLKGGNGWASVTRVERVRKAPLVQAFAHNVNRALIAQSEPPIVSHALQDILLQILEPPVALHAHQVLTGTPTKVGSRAPSVLRAPLVRISRRIAPLLAAVVPSGATATTLA
jgi:hypothetical protein